LSRRDNSPYVEGHELLNAISNQSAMPSTEVDDTDSPVTDAELRDKILRWFYEHRREGLCNVQPATFPDIPAAEITRICDQLRGLGLIEWKKAPGGEAIGVGLGKIAAKGSTQIELATTPQRRQQANVSESTYSYCHECGGDRNHEILKMHINEESFPDPVSGEPVTFGETSQLLKCKGCGFVSMRKAQWSSEMDYDDQPVWRYFPPQHSKPLPKWLKDFHEISNLPLVLRCLIECYEAFSANAVWIACVGARSVLEQVMIQKASDQGSFGKNLQAF
jgi:hypothetical protein